MELAAEEGWPSIWRARLARDDYRLFNGVDEILSSWNTPWQTPEIPTMEATKCYHRKRICCPRGVRC